MTTEHSALEKMNKGLFIDDKGEIYMESFDEGASISMHATTKELVRVGLTALYVAWIRDPDYIDDLLKPVDLVKLFNNRPPSE